MVTTQLSKIVENSILNDTQKQFFLKNGYVGPFSVPNNLSVTKLRHTIKKSSQKSQLLMEGSTAHVFSIPIFKIATEASILNKVSSLLSPDLLLWMGQVIFKQPGDSPTFWHIDKVNYAVDGVHASIAITDMTINNGCLQVIPGTHKYKDDLEEYVNKRECDLYNAESIVQLADRLHPENAPHQVVPIEMKAGEYFFTKGGLWHGVTANQTEKLRLGLVVRYMRTDVNSEQVIGRGLSCILVRGKDKYKFNTLYQPCLSQFHIMYNRFLPYKRLFSKKLKYLILKQK